MTRQRYDGQSSLSLGPISTGEIATDATCAVVLREFLCSSLLLLPCFYPGDVIWFVLPFSRDVSWNGSQERSAKATWPERINSRPIATDFLPFLYLPRLIPFLSFFFHHWWCLYFSISFCSDHSAIISFSPCQALTSPPLFARNLVSKQMFLCISYFVSFTVISNTRVGWSEESCKQTSPERGLGNKNEWPISDNGQILLEFFFFVIFE